MKKHEAVLPFKKPVESNPLKDDIITIVSGLPRSGTSMMMKMLDCGNMPTLTDHFREADIDNPKGYYEFEKVKRLALDTSWLGKGKGKAVKIVSPLLQLLPINSSYKYKIIFMLRSLDEVLASQRKMADRLNENETRIKENILRNNYTEHLEEVRYWMETTENIEFIYVNYTDVLYDPYSAAEGIQDFLGIALHTAEMAKTINPSLYRHRIDTNTCCVTTDSPDADTEKEAIMNQLKQLGYL